MGPLPISNNEANGRSCVPLLPCAPWPWVTTPTPCRRCVCCFAPSKRADSLFVHTMGEIDLSPRQFAVLQAVADAEGLGQTAIMSARGLDRASTADLVRRLVAKGWLRRRRTKRDARMRFA